MLGRQKWAFAIWDCNERKQLIACSMLRYIPSYILHQWDIKEDNEWSYKVQQIDWNQCSSIHNRCWVSCVYSMFEGSLNQFDGISAISVWGLDK
jgi:hypothetical protein